MDENENKDVDFDNNDDAADELEDEGTDEGTSDKAKAEKPKPKRTPEEQLAYLEGRTTRLRTKLGLTTPRVAKDTTNKEAPSKTGELDETQLDYLDLKGISEAEDIAIIERHVKRTGETVRQALKDDFVLSKLEANKNDRDVKGATPSSTKRGGGQTNDLALAIAKFDATGELPDDFALRTAVVNAKVDQSSGNKPSWH